MKKLKARYKYTDAQIDKLVDEELQAAGYELPPTSAYGKGKRGGRKG